MPSIEYDTVSFERLLEDDETGKLVVPNFQRKFEWDREAQGKLAASVLSGLPIGTLVLLRGDGKTFANRRLCFTGLERPSEGEVTYVLDGQQRLSALRTVFADFFDPPSQWEARWADTPSKLRNRWALRFPDREDGGFDFGLHSEAPVHFSLEGATKLAGEPSDILEQIEHFWILKKEKEDSPWYHPQREVDLLNSGEKESTLQYRIANEAAGAGFVPLWDVQKGSKETNTLQALALKVIAQEHRAYLEALLGDDPHCEDIRKTIAQVDPDLATEHYDIEQAKDALNTLAAEWQAKAGSTLSALASFEIPAILLTKDQLKKATVIFENINRGGTPLSVFDMVCARAVPGYETLPSLRERLDKWMTAGSIDLPSSQRAFFGGEETLEKENLQTHDDPAEGPVPSVRNRFLNLLAIAGHFGPAGHFTADSNGKEIRFGPAIIKQEGQLALESKAINDWAEDVSEAALRGLVFLRGRCGIITPSDLKYDLLMLPVSYVLSVDRAYENPKVWDRLEYWYWISLFGGRYRERQYDVCVDDIRQIYEWCLDDRENPFADQESRILAEPRYSDKAVFLHEYGEDSRPSQAVGVGLLQFLLASRLYDMWPEDEYEELELSPHLVAQERELELTGKRGNANRILEPRLESHHIVPLAAASSLKMSSKQIRGSGSLYNSYLNQTLITKEANRHIRGFGPEEYLVSLSEAVLQSHALPMSGEEIREKIEHDDVSAEPPKEEGIKDVLSKRFETIKQLVRSRVVDLKHSF